MTDYYGHVLTFEDEGFFAAFVHEKMITIYDKGEAVLIRYASHGAIYQSLSRIFEVCDSYSFVWLLDIGAVAVGSS